MNRRKSAKTEKKNRAGKLDAVVLEKYTEEPPNPISDPPVQSSSSTYASGSATEESPGAVAIGVETLQRRTPGFISPHENASDNRDQENQSPVPRDVENLEVPVAATLSPDADDIACQVRHILAQTTIQANEVVAIGGIDDRQKMPAPDVEHSGRCKWLILAMVGLLIVVGVAVGLGVGANNDNITTPLGSTNLVPTTVPPTTMPPTPEVQQQTLPPTPEPQLCEQDSDCMNGRCGYESYTGSAKAICCPSGEKEYVSSFEHGGYPKQSSAYFCTSQAPGTRCPTNTLCGSNVCAFSTCQAQHIEVGGACEENIDCASTVCIFDVCEAGPRPEPELCEEDRDCLNGRCGYESYTGSAKAICCPSGEKEYVSSFEHGGYPKQSSAYFCTSQAPGTLCPTNTLCGSNVCAFSTCQAQHIEVGGACEENIDCASTVCIFGVCEAGPREESELCEEDRDCLNGRCGYESYTGSAQAICCPSGAKEYVSSFEHGGYPKQSSAYFCTSQALGTLCPTNTLCGSNQCTSGVCV
jgi:hypothetical protein